MSPVDKINALDYSTLNLAALAPEIIVIITALVIMVLDMVVREKHVLGYLSLLGLGVAGASCFMLFGVSPAPTFQNMAVSDGYSLVLDLIFIITAIFSVLIALSYLDHKGLQKGEYYTLLLFSTSGMMMMGAATDLIIVFLGLELMSIALYVMAAFNRDEIGSGEAGMKYFILGAFASAFFLYGVALIYGATGSTNLQAIGEWFAGEAGNPNDPLALVGLGLLLVGFAFKVAAVPFQWWTPDVYHGAPTSATAFMSVGAKAAGFAALIRILMVAFGGAFRLDWQLVIATLAMITMTVGNVAALAQKDVKRMLAYSSVAHAGYLLVGVVAVVPGVEMGVKSVLFYLMSYAFMNIGAFAVIATLERRDEIGSALTDYAGLSKRKPLLAIAMAFFMFSLIGIPPFVGFWGKMYVFSAAVEIGFWWLAVVGVFNSAISAFYYLGVVVQMYMRSPSDVEAEPAPIRLSGPITVTVAVASVLTILLGFWPTPLVALTDWGLLFG